MHNSHDHWRLIPSGVTPHHEINKPGYKTLCSQNIYTGKRQSPWKPQSTEVPRGLQKLPTSSRLLRATPDQFLTIPTDRDSTTSLCSTKYTVKNLFFSAYKWSFLHFIQCPLLPAISLGTTEESGSISFTSNPSGIYTY